VSGLWIASVAFTTWQNYPPSGLTDEEVGLPALPNQAQEVDRENCVRRRDPIEARATLALIPPAFVLIVGSAFYWAARGFRNQRHPCYARRARAFSNRNLGKPQPAVRRSPPCQWRERTPVRWRRTASSRALQSATGATASHCWRTVHGDQSSPGQKRDRNRKNSKQLGHLRLPISSWDYCRSSQRPPAARRLWSRRCCHRRQGRSQRQERQRTLVLIGLRKICT
jgi:hypothetical protein